MALRLPIPARSVRRASRTRSVITIGFAAFVYIALPLRIFLAAVGIADWTMSWRTVRYITYPLVKPIEVISPFESQLVGEAGVTDFIALFIFGAIALYFLALLTVQRRR